MTKEEAKRYWTAKYEAASKWDDPHWEASERKEHRRYVDALKAAIEALSEPSGDLISRADAIEAVCDGCVWYKTASCEEGKEEWECSEVNKIRHLPSADRPTGEWVKVIDKDTRNEVTWHYECDQCGAGRWENDQRYCSNCGADMRGEEHE